MQKKPITKEKALERLESLCSRSEQCQSDLIRKLINWGITSTDRKEIMETLIENRFVDDARFARSYASDKARFSAWGPNKIKAELIKRRIKANLISEALKNVEQATWKSGLLRCVSNKAKNLDLTGEEEWDNRQKLFRYLISRGFPSSSVSKAINFIQSKQEEEQ